MEEKKPNFDKKKKVKSNIGEGTKDILFLIGLFVAFGLIWYYTGGPGRELSKKGIRLPNTVIDKHTQPNSFIPTNGTTN